MVHWAAKKKEGLEGLYRACRVYRVYRVSIGFIGFKGWCQWCPLCPGNNMAESKLQTIAADLEERRGFAVFFEEHVEKDFLVLCGEGLCQC